MEAKVSEILLIARSVPNYTLHQAPDITNFFVLTSFMGPPVVNFIRVIIQTQNNEVYNVIHRDLIGKLYHALSIKYVEKRTPYSNNYVQQSQLHEKRPRVPTYISYDSI